MAQTTMTGIEWVIIASGIATLGILTHRIIRHWQSRPRLRVSVDPDVATAADLSPSASDSETWISIRVTAKGRDLNVSHLFLDADGHDSIALDALYRTTDGQSVECTLPVSLAREEVGRFLAKVPRDQLPRGSRRPRRTPPMRVVAHDDRKELQGTSSEFRIEFD